MVPVIPEYDHFGQKIPAGAIFFKTPTIIGDIVSASTSYYEGAKALTSQQILLKYLKNIGIAALIAGAIVLIGRVSNPIWFSIWFAVPIIIALIATGNSTKFKGVCNYIGSNGFAEYGFMNLPENIVSNTEISFDNVTDILKGSVVKKRNFNYEGTDYFFLWLNKGTVVYKLESTHQNKNNEPGKYPFEYHFMSLAVSQWTRKLVEQIPEKLAKNGCLEFDLVGKKDEVWFNVKHIRLGIGYIEFIFSDQTVRYNHDEIKKMYFKDGSLFMEHKNYEKKFFGFVEKGNKNSIPLTNLSNQPYFFHAFEKMMGYSL
ncbi:MAG: hypothetical protein KBA90_04155 [Chitinophagaceae bacterium]|jgi:hypothetical protein|nr:hypothetical protein [Chitinophagaceae bacterium]